MALGVPASTYEWWEEGTQHSVRAVAVRVLGIQPACPRRAPSIPRAHDSSQPTLPPSRPQKEKCVPKQDITQHGQPLKPPWSPPGVQDLKRHPPGSSDSSVCKALPSHTILKVQLGQNVNRLGIYQTIRLLFTP